MMLLVDVSQGEDNLISGLRLREINEVLLLHKNNLFLTNSKFVLEKLGLRYETLEIKDFENNVVEIYKKIKDKEIVISLSEKDIGFLSFLYAISLMKQDAKIAINGVEIGKVSDFQKISISNDEVQILKYINGGVNNISKLSKFLNSSITTTWRRVKELEEKGLISELHLTTKGKVVLKIFS